MPSTLSMLLAAAPGAQLAEPLVTPSSLLVGSGAYLIMAGLGLVALVGIPLRSLGIVASWTRWLVQHTSALWARRRAVVDPQRPLTLAGLSPALSRLAQQTRTLALELRRRSEQARHWPDDAGELEQVRLGWLRALLTETIDLTPVLDTRREVYDWVRSAENLSAGERERLAGLGVDVDAVRELLTAKIPVADLVRTLAGLMWSIDERLAGASTSGYRSSGYGPAQQAGASASFLPIPGLGSATDDDDERSEARERQRAFVRVVGEHGRGLSRLAGSYTRNPAEREDLEQDIHLALWKSLPKFRGEASLKTFVYRVARYCCYRHIRRRGRLLPDTDALDRVGDPGLGVEEQLLEADERAQVQRALAALPAKLESTMSLHLSGLSYAEIAERLGISERNVSVRLTRARHRLRAQLA